MASDLIEPAPISPTPPTGEPPAPPIEPPPPPATPPVVPPGLESTSGDELSAFLAQPRPDPLLGEFHDEGGRSRRKGSVSSSSADALKSIRLGQDRPPGGRSAAALEDEEDDRPGFSWGVMLLASYASAVTIALAWLLWSGRRLPEPEPADEPPAASPEAPDPGVRAGRSRYLTRAEAAPAAETTLGQPVRIGSLEVTPRAASWATVVLERKLTTHTLQKGGRDALRLSLSIKNTSANAVFAPLDEAFLREGRSARADSSIDLGGRKAIGLFPLSVESEWSIVDQRFAEIGPGEVLESAVFSAPDVPRPLAGPATWLIRLRTDVGATGVLAVRVAPDQIAAEPAH